MSATKDFNRAERVIESVTYEVGGRGIVSSKIQALQDVASVDNFLNVAATETVPLFEHLEFEFLLEYDVDDIEIEADSHVSNDGSAVVAGTVTNVSETPIDVIDLEVIFYGADEEYLSAQLITVTDVGIGESKKFEAEIGPDEAHGQPERVELNPDVYDRAD